jgi:hypothetical protein
MLCGGDVYTDNLSAFLSHSTIIYIGFGFRLIHILDAHYLSRLNCAKLSLWCLTGQTGIERGVAHMTIHFTYMQYQATTEDAVKCTLRTKKNE